MTHTSQNHQAAAKMTTMTLCLALLAAATLPHNALAFTPATTRSSGMHTNLKLLGRGADLGPSSSSSADTQYQYPMEPRRSSLLQAFKKVKFNKRATSLNYNGDTFLRKSLLLMAAKTKSRKTLTKTGTSSSTLTSRRRKPLSSNRIRKPSLKTSPVGVAKFLGEHVWTSPFIILAIIMPLHYAVVHNSFPVLPAFYPLQRPFHYYHTAALGGVLLTKLSFLGSNVAYFMSGSYLLNLKQSQDGITQGKKRFFRVNPRSASPAALQKSAGAAAALETVDAGFDVSYMALETAPQDAGSDLAFPKLLGGMVWASGIVSAVYHVFQTIDCPDYMVESLCYLDHGVAVSSVLFFIKTCGIPRLRTLTIGAISLMALKPKGAMYAYTHSLWHFLSAAVTISWAHDGIQRQLRRNSRQGQTGTAALA